ncbi:MAG: response regulator [Salinibacter sp.]|jgi:Response regulator containing CheY-like receiver, AAA-type ATPase, and DNA-binding domains|uniref:response regulator n=1 Tax=Salinibacter sp. TaxID=2065818 RepID=UPI002FC2A0B6
MGTSEPPRILSVEDNPDTRLLLKHTLQNEYDLTLVSGVEEAIDHMAAGSFDLLLLDINLGERDGGTGLLHTIRSREVFDDVPAIAVTAFAMPGDREELLQKGFDAYVGKPFTQDQLVGTIEDTLSAL